MRLYIPWHRNGRRGRKDIHTKILVHGRAGELEMQLNLALNEAKVESKCGVDERNYQKY